MGEKNKLKSDRSKDNDDSSHFVSFDSIIPESSPLKKGSDSDAGFYNDNFSSKGVSKDFSSKRVSNDNLDPDDLDGLMKNMPNTYIPMIHRRSMI